MFMIVIFFFGFTPFALSLYIRQVFANMNGLFCTISQFSKTDKNKLKIIVLESQIKQAEETRGIAWVVATRWLKLCTALSIIAFSGGNRSMECILKVNPNSLHRFYSSL